MAQRRNGAQVDRQGPAGSAKKCFRRLKAYRQLPILRNALRELMRKRQADSALETISNAA